MFSLRRLNERWLSPGRGAPKVSDNSTQDQDEDETSANTPCGRRLSWETEGRLVEDYSSEELHFIVNYVGSAQISEAQSVPLLLETMKRVKKHQVRSLRVDFTIRDGVLKVSCVDSNSLVLTAPLYAVALCAHEQLRGFESTFGCNITRKGTHMSHVFQAGSQYEAASIVRTLAFAFKTIGKMIREKKEKHVHQQRHSSSISSSERTRTNSEVSTTSTADECIRETRQRKKGIDHTSGRRYSHSKLGSKKFTRSSASPSILRHSASSHTPGRHVEFSPLSPVPSDGSGSDNKESIVKEEVKLPAQVVVEPAEKRFVVVEVHPVPPAMANANMLETALPKQRKTSLEASTVCQEDSAPIQRREPASEEKVGECDVSILKHPVQSLPASLYHKESISDYISVAKQELLCTKNEEIHSAVNAILRGDKAHLEKCLDDGLSVNAKDSTRRTLLYHAVSVGKADITQMLLRRGAEVNWEGPEDKSPLHVAAAEGYRAVTQLLLANGANVRAKDNTFCTPLHMSASLLSNLEVSYLLIEHGARIYENNIQGERPVDLNSELREMQRLLVKSACEAFAAADVSKSRSSSNASSNIQWSANSSFRSKSSAGSFQQGPSQQSKRSLSLCSIASKGGTVRGKCVLERSESIHLPRTLSPLLGGARKASLMRSRSLQRPARDLGHDFDLPEHPCKVNTTSKQGRSHQTAGAVETDVTASVETDAVASVEMDVTASAGADVTASVETDMTASVEADVTASVETDVTASVETDVTASVEADVTVSVEADVTASVETDVIASVETDVTASVETDVTASVETDVTASIENAQQTKENAQLVYQDQKSVTQAASNVESDAHTEGEHSGEARVLQKTMQENQTIPQLSLEMDTPTGPGNAHIVYSGMSECEDNSLTSTGSHVMHDEDYVIDALKSVVLLSGNPECHSSLLAHLCLPKSSSQLVALGQQHEAASVIANHIAVLIGNLFNLEGPDSRKRSVEAGLIKTVLKLVNSTEPIQSTCLSILHNILDFDNDREYSTALNNIPLEPLLNLLQASDADSGAFDLRPPESPPPLISSRHDRQRRRKRSSCSQSSFDEKHREMSPVPCPVSVGHSSVPSVQRNNSGASDVRSQKRNSMCSIASSAEDHSFPFYSPGFGHTNIAGLGPGMGLGPDPHTKTLPKVVASKMLAATSIHPKMRIELGKVRPLSLLLEASADRNTEIAIYATAAVANIAASVKGHLQVEAVCCSETLKQLLNHSDPWVRYHAARGLIYLGHVNVGKIYLFKRIPGDGKLDVIFADSTDDERLYVRGATVEKIVEILSNNPLLLWGGVNLPAPSPHQSRDKRSLGRTSSPSARKSATEEQIIDFLLTVYQSFVHPVIFLRLLIHRFHDPWFDKYFDGDPSTGQIERYSPLPVTHIHLMRLWKAWLDKYPEHFNNDYEMASELSDLIIPMRRAGGPYLPCADNLEDLISHLVERASEKCMDHAQENHCHHNILYAECQKAVVEGDMFCPVKDVIYLSSLQLYIEDFSQSECRGRQWFQSAAPDKLSASRIKQSLRSSLYREKNISNRIRALHEDFVHRGMSERMAKHTYVDYCQEFPSYGCTFFRMKECMGTVSEKAGSVRRLFGISPKKIVLLDEKTKHKVGTWQFNELKRWTSVANDTRLRVEFVNLSFEFLPEDKSTFKKITEVMFNCTRANFKVLAGQDFSPWSKYAEETEIWGPRALHAEAHKPGLGVKYDSDSSAGPRVRAISLASSVPGPPQKKFQRQFSAMAMLSSSAPHQQGIVGDVGPSNLIGSDAAFGAPGARDSPTSGQGSLSGTHNSEEHLLGSLQNTPASPRWWEEGSLPSGSGGVTWPTKDRDPNVDEPGFPTDSHSLPNRTGVQPSKQNQLPPQTRAENPAVEGAASFGCEAERDIAELTRKAMFGGVVPHEEMQNINRPFLLSPAGQLLVCHCASDAEMPGFDRRNFTAFDLLQHPKELARQITLIDHEYYRAVTAEDIQKKIALGTGKKRNYEVEGKLAVEKVADRFNQLSTWVVASILTEDSVERRAKMFINFIETAKLCLILRNFNAVMAVVVAALGSAPIRRLYRTKELIPKEFLEQFAKMEILMDTRNNYKRYREALCSSAMPTVPYFGIFMKDLTFIAEGNPDYLKGGLINLTKRRLVYLVIDQVRRFQQKLYNFQKVPEVHQYLVEQEIHTEEELHKISRQLEPGLPRRYSETSSGPGPLSMGRMSARRKFSLNRSSTTLNNR